MPAVSVVVPTYGRANILPRALDSVLSQTYSDFELIVVDDCSPDDTNKIVDSYSDNRIMYLRHEQNRGANAARNTGIKAANGEYLAFLDDDDKWLPEKLEQQMALYDKLDESFGLVYTGRRIVNSDEVIERYIPQLEGNIYPKLLRKNVIPSETPLIRTDCFDNVGLFDTGLRSCQDWDMWLRIAKNYKISFVPDILAVSFWDTNDRISRDYGRKFQGYCRLHKKYRVDIYKDPFAAWHFLTRLCYFYSLRKITNVL